MWLKSITLAGLLAVAPARDVAELDWLSGAWVSETQEGWTEEMWTRPRGGVMLGTNLSGKGGETKGFEFMRVVCESSDCTFYASPSGSAPVAFRERSRFNMPNQNIHEMTFENPANDYPTRIVYRRRGEILIATISGPDGKNPMTWTFRRR